MGAYLSTPLTDKISTDETNSFLACGASQMQGWRMSQEVHHFYIISSFFLHVVLYANVHFQFITFIFVVNEMCKCTLTPMKSIENMGKLRWSKCNRNSIMSNSFGGCGMKCAFVFRTILFSFSFFSFYSFFFRCLLFCWKHRHSNSIHVLDLVVRRDCLTEDNCGSICEWRFVTSSVFM